MALFIAIFVSTSSWAWTWPWSLEGDWAIQKSEVSYEVKHPLHNCSGSSNETTGTIRCEKSKCQIQLRVMVRSFVSRDSDKDQDMNKHLKSEEHPVVKVEGPVDIRDDHILLTPTLSVAGVSKTLKPISVQIEKSLANLRVKTVFEWNIHDFNIVSPRLIGIAIDPNVKMFVDLELKKKMF